MRSLPFGYDLRAFLYLLSRSLNDNAKNLDVLSRRNVEAVVIDLAWNPFKPLQDDLYRCWQKVVSDLPPYRDATQSTLRVMVP